MNGLKGDGSGAYVDSLFKQDRSGSRCKVARTFKLLCESTVKLTATRGNCKSTMKKILVLERTIEQLHQLAEGPTALTPNSPSAEARTCCRRLSGNGRRAAAHCWNTLRVRELPEEDLFLNDMVCFFYNQIYTTYKIACDHGPPLSSSGNRQLASLDWAKFFIEVGSTEYARGELEKVKGAMEEIPSSNVTSSQRRHRLRLLDALESEFRSIPP